MLQRIQTLFFLGVIIAQGIIIKFPIWIATSTAINTEWILNSYSIMELKNGEIVSNTPAWYTSLAIILTLLLTVYTIFAFKNRKKQMLYSTIISFLILCTSVSFLYFIYTIREQIGQNGNIQWLPLSMIIVSFILNMMAKIYIKKDDNLVKSVDRLR